MRSRRGAAAALALAGLLLAIPLAGCLGSSGPSDAGETDESTDDNAGTDPSAAPNGSDGNASDAPPSDRVANETEEESDDQTRHETRSRSETINASTSFPFIEGFPEEARWVPYDDKPGNFTAILIEVDWETETKGTDLGELLLQYETERGGLRNQTWARDGVLRQWVAREEYGGGSLSLAARPAGGDGGNAFVDVWVQAEVTFYVTAFYGGPPAEDFSAAE